MVRLILAQRSDEPRLFAALQDYLRELAPLYGDAPDEKGEFPYPYLSCYFSEPRRLAYLIYNDDDWAGFALVNDHSFSGAPVDHAIAEFTVFPSFRGTGTAAAAAQALLKAHPGRWHLKYSLRNRAGARFWKKVTASYSPLERALNKHEHWMTFEVSGDEN